MPVAFRGRAVWRAMSEARWHRSHWRMPTRALGVQVVRSENPGECRAADACQFWASFSPFDPLVSNLNILVSGLNVHLLYTPLLSEIRLSVHVSRVCGYNAPSGREGRISDQSTADHFTADHSTAEHCIAESSTAEE